MLFTRRKQGAPVPEVGSPAPEFHLPSAQGGQFRLSLRIVRGPVVVIFFRGAWSEEDVGYFQQLAAKETEINHAGGSIVGIGAMEPDEAREFARLSGIKSYVLYDYQRVTTRGWGLLEQNKERGEYARPAVFVVGTDGNVTHAWLDERPSADEILATVSAITGLPKPAEEAEEEKPKRSKKGDEDGGAAEGSGAEGSGGAAVDEKPKKMSAEERERIKAERRAAREAGKSVKTAGAGGKTATGGAAGGEKPKKMSAEERERIKAERRAAREAGRSVKTVSASDQTATHEGTAAVEPAAEEARPKKMSAEERERIKAERRAAREAGRSLKKPVEAPRAGTPDGAEAGDGGTRPAEATGPPEAAEE